MAAALVWPSSSHLVRLVALVALLGLVTACNDSDVPNAPGSPPLPSTARLLTCDANVQARTLTCPAQSPASTAPGASKISADLILGGQGISVQLRSSNVSYNATTEIFQADVTGQNLMELTLGTPDGSTVTGVKVFFHSGPSVVSGSGAVTVANAVGTGTFTGTNQPYFLYNQTPQMGQVSSARTWEWAVPSTVVTFGFQVLVAAAATETPPPELHKSWTPRAISVTSSGTATLTVLAPGSPTAVRIAAATGGSVDLVKLSAYRWETTFPVSSLVAGYTTGDAHQFVGYLDLYDGATRTFRGNEFVNVRDATMPDVEVSPMAADLQASAHVVNLRYDSLYLGGSVPPVVVQRFYQAFPDGFDFLAVAEQVESFHNRFYWRVSNNVVGLGLPRFDNTMTYGSAGRLQGIVHYPTTPFFDLADKGSVHEIGHRWINWLSTPTLALGRPHWPISDLAYGIMGYSQGATRQGSDFPYELVLQPGGDYLLECPDTARGYNDLELYLIGLVSKDAVSPHIVFTDQGQTASLRCNGLLHGPVQTVTIADVIAADGERPPASQRDFTMASLVLSRGRLLTGEQMAFFDHMAARGEGRVEVVYTEGFIRAMTKPFYVATGGRATLVTQVQ